MKSCVKIWDKSDQWFCHVTIPGPKLLVSDIKKIKKSSPSMYRDVHVLHHSTLLLTLTPAYFRWFYFLLIVFESFIFSFFDSFYCRLIAFLSLLTTNFYRNFFIFYCLLMLRPKNVDWKWKVRSISTFGLVFLLGKMTNLISLGFYLNFSFNNQSVHLKDHIFFPLTVIYIVNLITAACKKSVK